MKRLLLLTPVLLLAALFAVAGISCVTNSLTGSRGLVLVPDEIMNDLGAQSYAELSRQVTPSRNSQQTQVVQRISQRIAAASGASYSWEFKLVESNEANAFCLPGGKIMVYTGILAPAANEAALAFIVGHEVGHAVAKHGAQRLSQALLLQGALVALSETTLRNNPNRELILAGLGLGSQVGILLPFSRAHESEADRMGLIYAARAGYDPREAPKFWTRMGAGAAKPPEFLSTHPSDVRRASDLNLRMQEAMSIYAKSSQQVGIGDRFVR